MAILADAVPTAKITRALDRAHLLVLSENGGEGATAQECPEQHSENVENAAGVEFHRSAPLVPTDPIYLVVGPSSRPTSRVTSVPLLGYLSQVGPFSYLVSAILMCLAFLAAWQYKIADRLDRLESVHRSPPAGTSPPGATSEPVGYVTGMADCRWNEDLPERDEERAAGLADLAISSPLCSGRKIRLASGQLEIGYQSGASVTLRGPAVFEVDAQGGFLLIGELTGKFERKVDRFNPQSTIPHSAVFAIRTPTAVVTDLGTEFRVRVDSAGRTVSQVIRGAVRVHPAAANDNRLDCILHENEAAHVQRQSNQGILIRRIANDRDNEHRSVAAYGTGMQQKALQGDPHWEVAALSGHPDFQPVAASRVSVPAEWRAGCGANWISTFAVLPNELRDGTTCTFRTTIQVTNAAPAPTVVRGWFRTNGHVSSIRLNENSMSVPQHGEEACTIFQDFTLDHGFSDGANILEIDVVKVETPKTFIQYSPFIAICVDFDAAVLPK
jgi:hypothetical protein